MNFFEWGAPREELFEYDGETLRHCDGCLKDINEKDLTVVIPYKYKNESLREIWHKKCYEEHNAATWY